MTDDQVLAKVRAATTRALENMTCLCVSEGGRTPVATCKHCHGSAYLVTDETICARAALALVEMVEKLEFDGCRIVDIDDLLSALRTAVGEVQP